MKPFIADYRNLDESTRDYVERVAKVEGRGAPGIYLPGGTNGWPVISLIAGGAIIFFGLGFVLALPKAPWASAMLLTAIALSGGWMVLYPIRRWFFGGMGTFQYFDPHTVYESNAGEVTVTHVVDATEVELTENYNDGTYTSTSLHFNMPGRSRTVTVKNRKKADEIAEYYGHLHEFADDPGYRNYSPAEQGGVAKYIAKEGEPPADLKLLDLTIADMPMEPGAKKTGTPMLLRYLAIISAGCGIYFASWAFLSPVQDEIAYTEAGKHGVQGYRDYLLDHRNTAHRDEAKAKIKELYQPAIAKANACPDEAERKAWVQLLTDLADCEGMPVVSLKVTGDAGGDAVRTWMADSIGSYFGPAFIVFVNPVEDSKPLLEMTQSTEGFTMTYRRTPDTPEAETITTSLRTLPTPTVPGGVIITSQPTEQFKTVFFTTTFGVPPPTIHVAPVNAGDSGD